MTKKRPATLAEIEPVATALKAFDALARDTDGTMPEVYARHLATLYHACDRRAARQDTEVGERRKSERRGTVCHHPERGADRRAAPTEPEVEALAILLYAIDVKPWHVDEFTAKRGTKTLADIEHCWGFSDEHPLGVGKVRKKEAREAAHAFLAALRREAQP